MYGTIARMRPKTGQESVVIELMREWGETKGKTTAGYKASYVYRPDRSPEEIVLVVAFADKQSYDRNAGDPEQDKWYGRLREALQSDPDWEDGQIIYG